jgi:hypothetical protein
MGGVFMVGVSFDTLSFSRKQALWRCTLFGYLTRR